MRKLLCPLLVFGFASQAAALPPMERITLPSIPQTAAPLSGQAQSGQTEDVGFRNEDGDRMTVSVRLSGTGPYHFLVDTGASHTAISRSIAERLHLTGSDEASLHSITGVSNVVTTNIPDLQFARRELKIVDAPLLESEHMGADGILGVDSLKSQRVVFDFEAANMAIMPSSVPDRMDDAGAIVIEARRRSGRLIVTDAKANGKRVTVVVDTGSQVSIGNEALRQLLLSGQLVDPNQQVELMSVTGQMLTGNYMFIKNMELGDAGLKNLAVVFAEAHTFKQLGLTDRPTLLLGMNAMRAFKKVSIDFANRKFKVIVPERSELQLRLAELRKTGS